MSDAIDRMREAMNAEIDLWGFWSFGVTGPHYAIRKPRPGADEEPQKVYLTGIVAKDEGRKAYNRLVSDRVLKAGVAAIREADTRTRATGRAAALAKAGAAAPNDELIDVIWTAMIDKIVRD